MDYNDRTETKILYTFDNLKLALITAIISNLDALEEFDYCIKEQIDEMQKCIQKAAISEKWESCYNKIL